MNEENSDNKIKLTVRLGEIFWCYLGINIGSEQNGSGTDRTRPILIINKFSERFFLGAPLTSKKREGDWYAKIPFNNSSVILNQIRPVDIQRLGLSMGKISMEELEKVIEKYINLIKTKSTND